MKNITVKEFKIKYPRQYKYIKSNILNKTKVFDMQGLIYLYVNNLPLPSCSVCGKLLTITNHCRNKVTIPTKCNKHINVIKTYKLEDVISIHAHLKVIEFPNLIQCSKTITVECNKHGKYKTSVGFFINGGNCQQCYFENMIGHTNTKHTDETKLKLSLAKIGKKVTLSKSAMETKISKQKLSWVKRKSSPNYKEYIKQLSIRRKEYIKKHGTNHIKYDTSLEKNFENFLITYKLNYEKQKIVGYKKYDFYLLDLNLLVEVDGEYWHNFTSSKKK